MSRHTLRVVDGVSAALALVAVLLAFWPANEQPADDFAVPASLATRPARGALAAAPGIDSTALAIVQGNVFSSTRRAPDTRFMPPGSDAPIPMADAVSPMTDYSLPASTDSSAEAGARDPVPSLYGIVGIQGVMHALLGLRSGEPPRLLAVGDRHAGYRISAIERDRVILATAHGSRTLRLAQPAPRDSSENMP